MHGQARSLHASSFSFALAPRKLWTAICLDLGKMSKKGQKQLKQLRSPTRKAKKEKRGRRKKNKKGVNSHNPILKKKKEKEGGGGEGEEAQSKTHLRWKKESQWKVFRNKVTGRPSHTKVA